MQIISINTYDREPVKRFPIERHTIVAKSSQSIYPITKVLRS